MARIVSPPSTWSQSRGQTSVRLYSPHPVSQMTTFAHEGDMSRKQQVSPPSLQHRAQFLEDAVKSVSRIAALAAALMIVPVAAHAQATPSAASKTAAKPKYKRDLPPKLVKEAKVTESVAADA